MVIETSSGAARAERLRDAINQHNLDAMAECFASDFVNETPVHPARSFTGRDQVRKNWTQIFAAVPDLKADLRACSADGETVWAEWEMSGTRRDGAAHLMRGVSLFIVKDDLLASVRFYLEPVEEQGPGVDAAIREALTR